MSVKPSWPALRRPSTRRRDKSLARSDFHHFRRLRQGCSVLVDGRVKPGHDGEPQSPTPPTPSAIRAKLSALIALTVGPGLNVGKAVMAGLAPAIHAAPRQVSRPLGLPSLQALTPRLQCFRGWPGQAHGCPVQVGFKQSWNWRASRGGSGGGVRSLVRSFLCMRLARTSRTSSRKPGFSFEICSSARSNR